MAETYYKNVNGVHMEMDDDEVAELLASREAADLDFNMVRSERDNKLRHTDWTQIADAALGSHTAEEWATYRQELRDLPSKHSKVSEVVWPTPPE